MSKFKTSIIYDLILSGIYVFISFGKCSSVTTTFAVIHTMTELIIIMRLRFIILKWLNAIC